LHSFQDKLDFEKVDWEHFVSVNKMFARAACDEASADGIVWVHDYNLWLAPYFIRQERPELKIAFFFHTPFPAADIFNSIPWRKQIIESLLSCDVCHFDIPRYVENFVSTAISNMPVEVLKKVKVEPYYSAHGLPLSEPMITKKIRYKSQVIKLNAFPEGTNAELIQQHLKESDVMEIINSWKF
jgi:glucosylglycerol-phosphate synthase